MYLSNIGRNSVTFCFQSSKKLLSVFDLQPCLTMTIPRRSISTSMFNRRSTSRKILPYSTASLNKQSVRTSHDGKMFSLEKLGIPKKLIGWHHRLLLRWKLGNNFDAASFFDGVMGSFVHVTECIANGNYDALQGLLTESALQSVTQYISDAENEKEPYQVEEKDIVLVKVSAVDFDSEVEYSGLRDVTVLTMYVWIAYMHDCLKVLEKSNPDANESWSGIAQKMSEIQQNMQKLSHHAEFKFERAYDQNLENPLTDWIISELVYRIPKSSEM